MLGLKQKIDGLAHRIGGTPSLLFISILIIAYVIAFITYVKHNQLIAKNYNHNSTVQYVINVAQLLNSTKVSDQEKAVVTLTNSFAQLSLTDSPIFNEFNDINFIKLKGLLKKTATNFQVSIPLNRKWLNFNVNTNNFYPATSISLLVIIQIIIVIAILFIIWTIRRFTKPLKKIQIATEKLAIDLNSPVIEALEGPTVIQEIVTTMNKMHTRIQELLADRTQMLASISHDLRTPITRLKLRAQFVQDDEQQEKMINDLDEMEAMIKQTLVFVRTNYDTEPKRMIDLSALLLSLCDDLVERGQQLTYKGPMLGVLLPARPIALKRALSNLLENAVKYSDDKEIFVNLTQEKDTFAIEIIDQGPGLPPESLQKVFAPFYRDPFVENDSQKKYPGFGLGLTIVKEIIQSHAGTIQLANCIPTGLKVTIVFKNNTNN